jgi:hypothetical protein
LHKKLEIESIVFQVDGDLSAQLSALFTEKFDDPSAMSVAQYLEKIK